MFYKKEKKEHFWFKSDKDKFWFGPFQAIYFKWENINFDFSFIWSLKSYKNLAGKWWKKIYLFDYDVKKWLLIKKDIIL